VAERILLYLRSLSLFCASSENSHDTLDIFPLLVENNFFGRGRRNNCRSEKEKPSDFQANSSKQRKNNSSSNCVRRAKRHTEREQSI
jgi:hypothetical protein